MIIISKCIIHTTTGSLLPRTLLLPIYSNHSHTIIIIIKQTKDKDNAYNVWSSDIIEEHIII